MSVDKWPSYYLTKIAH